MKKKKGGPRRITFYNNKLLTARLRVLHNRINLTVDYIPSGKSFGEKKERISVSLNDKTIRKLRNWLNWYLDNK